MKGDTMDRTFFARVKSEETALCFFDLSMIMANFPVPVAKVQETLPSNKLKPVQLMPGTAVVSLAAMEYRHIDRLTPFNEFGIAVPVLYGMTDNVPGLAGSYVYYMPATTQEACNGGIKIYGFSKFVAEISFEDTGEMRCCRVRAEGKDIITLEAKKLVTQPQSWDTYTYTVKDGQFLRTYIPLQGQSGTTDVKGSASYILGDHPIAEELRALGMDKTSVWHQYAPQLQAILYLPGERLPL
jgi:hypothetical protein